MSSEASKRSRPTYRSEKEHWEAWERGETRCPYCVGLDMRDFEATCDCSRIWWETEGKPLTISVVGRPDTAQTVKPHHYIPEVESGL